MDVYQRITDELRERRLFFKKEEESLLMGYVKATEINLLNLPQRSEGNYRENLYLNRKHSSCISIEIPNFLNDKKQKSEVKSKNEDMKKPNLKSLNGIFNFILLDFGKGLFDEKLDFDPSDEFENFKVSKKGNFDQKLKEIEIKSAIFNNLSEDSFFSLD